MAGRSPVVTIVVLAAAVLGVLYFVAGREGSGKPLSPDAYREKMVSTLAGIDPSSAPNGVDGMRDLADQFHDAADELGGVVPPAEVAQLHARFVQRLEEYADQLDSLADAGERGAVEFQKQLAEGGAPGQAWAQVFQQLAAQGWLTYQASP